MKRREALKTSIFLTGCGLSAATISSIVSGCQPEVKEFADSFLGHDQVSLLAEIVETIIPTTDSPGAKAAGVHMVIDQYVRDNFTSEEQEMFKAAISGIAEAGFAKMNNEERESFLVGMEAPEDSPNPFEVLRGLTCQAYFTSEVGATEALAFDPIPGEWKACIDVSEVGKAWAL